MKRDHLAIRRGTNQTSIIASFKGGSAAFILENNHTPATIAEELRKLAKRIETKEKERTK